MRLSSRAFCGFVVLAAFGAAAAIGCGRLAEEGEPAGNADAGAKILSGDAGAPSIDTSDAATLESVLATGLAQPLSLTVVGDKLFWIEQHDSGGRIRSVGVAGGTPISITSFTDLDVNLASDGTSLYFTRLPDRQAVLPIWAIMKCDLDGTNVTTITQGTLTPSENFGNGNGLFIVNGTLYLAAAPVGEAISGLTSVTQAGVVTALPAVAPGGISYLSWADETGLYFWDNGGDGGAPAFARSPLAGTAVGVWAVNAGFEDGSYAFVNGDVYVALNNNADAPETPITTITKITAGAGAGVDATLLVSLSNWTGTSISIAADTNGMFITRGGNLGVGAALPGIYSVSMTTGATTLVQVDPSATAEGLVLDAKNVYWFEQAFTDRAILHATAR